MLILIAEAKTMADCRQVISPQQYDSNHPLLESQADDIIRTLKPLQAAELAGTIGISTSLARKLTQMIYDFHNKNTGEEAIRAFSGVVFKAFDYNSLSAAEKDYVSGCVRIISSLYGWLRPNDIIKPYRFDFTSKIPPHNTTLAALMRSGTTACLINELESQQSGDIIDLLPSDAARCIDWKMIQGNANVWKIEFKEIVSGDKTRTPNAGTLKKLRGLLLRQIIQENIKTPQDLMRIESDHYIPCAHQTDEHTISFITA